MVVAWLKRKLDFEDKPKPQRLPRGRGPEGRRIYAIGDIHGRADLLKELQDKIRADAAREPGKTPVIVYLGDYLDRGPDSREVIEHFVTSPMQGFSEIHLIGNHEDQVLRFLDGQQSHGFAWLRQGGRETLESYGVLPPDWGDDEALARAQDIFARAFPHDHRGFLRGLPLAHEEGDYLFVHAGIRPTAPLNAQNAQDLLWIRGEFLTWTKDFGRIVVHGHSISLRPDLHSNRIGIDTGAYATGILTALVIDGDYFGFLQTGNPGSVASVA